MSLILDALRKADAERERGSVPGLRSQPVVPLSDAVGAPKAAARLGWPSVAIGVGVGLALAAVWLFIGRSSDERAPPRAATAPTLTSPTLSAPASSGASDAMPVPAPARAADAAPPKAAASADAPQPIAEPAPWTRPGERIAAPAASATASARAGGGATGDLPVYPHDLLPSQVRAALPPLSISGSIYSSDPRGRSLIVNGRLMREGNAVTPELTLEEIRLKSAIFAFRAYRFEVPF